MCFEYAAVAATAAAAVSLLLIGHRGLAGVRHVDQEFTLLLETSCTSILLFPFAWVLLSTFVPSPYTSRRGLDPCANIHYFACAMHGHADVGVVDSS